MKLLTTTDFSKLTGIPSYTIRRMSDKGMLNPVRSSECGRRYFGIQNIQEAKDIGILDKDFELPDEFK